MERKQAPKRSVKSRRKQQVYVGGPLFNIGERYTQARVAAILEASGYSTFLPQRDGFETTALYAEYIAQGLSPDEASAKVSSVIYAVDVYQVFSSVAIVATVAGACIDDGTVSETALANAMGKGVVLYGAGEVRAFTSAARFNPLVAGLSSKPGKIVDAAKNLPRETAQAIAVSRPLSLRRLSKPLRDAIERGRVIVKERKRALFEQKAPRVSSATPPFGSAAKTTIGKK